MKYYSEKKQTLSSKRALTSLVNALLKLLKSKSFEDITVQELCTESLISRATFYNYFEDKYDLLNYFWDTLKLKMDPMPSNIDEQEQYLELFLENCISFFDSNIESVNSILSNNDLSHYLINSYRIYLNDTILSKIKLRPCTVEFTIPYEMVAQYYTNALLTLLEWKYVHKSISSKEELLKYLKILINKSDLTIP